MTDQLKGFMNFLLVNYGITDIYWKEGKCHIYRQKPGFKKIHAEAIDLAREAWEAAVPRWTNVKDAMPPAGSVIFARYDWGALLGHVEISEISGNEDPENVFFGQWMLYPELDQDK